MTRGFVRGCIRATALLMLVAMLPTNAALPIPPVATLAPPWGVWVTETADVGRYTGFQPDLTLALDGSGRPHIMAGGQTDHYESSIRHVWHDGMNWRAEAVALVQARVIGMAIAADGTIHAAYSDVRPGEGKAYYAARTPDGVWTTEYVDTNTSGGGEVLIDAGGKVHMLYPYYGEGIHHAHRAGDNGWIIERVPTDSSARRLDATFDEAGNLHVAASDITTSGGRISHAVLQNGTWTTTTVDNNCFDPALAVRQANDVHILCERRHEALIHWHKEDGVWQSTIVRTGTALNPTAEVDAQGRVHVAYQVWNIGGSWPLSPSNLRYAYWDESRTWRTETVDLLSEATGDAPDIRIDIDGYPHIAHVQPWFRRGEETVANPQFDLVYSRPLLQAAS